MYADNQFVTDLNAEVIGILAQSRFNLVKRRFLHEFRLKLNISPNSNTDLITNNVEASSSSTLSINSSNSNSSTSIISSQNTTTNTNLANQTGDTSLSGATSINQPFGLSQVKLVFLTYNYI